MAIPPEFIIWTIFAIFGGIVLLICVCLCCFCCAKDLHASLIESESNREERTRDNRNRNDRIRNDQPGLSQAGPSQHEPSQHEPSLPRPISSAPPLSILSDQTRSPRGIVSRNIHDESTNLPPPSYKELFPPDSSSES